MYYGGHLRTFYSLLFPQYSQDGFNFPSFYYLLLFLYSYKFTVIDQFQKWNNETLSDLGKAAVEIGPTSTTYQYVISHIR